MYLNNKYTRWYFNIIKLSTGRTIDGYCERHHIIPRSLGGSNDSNNIAFLTAREHFICHLLLVKMTVGSDQHKMHHAAWTIARTRTGRIKVCARTYEILKMNATAKLKELQTGVPRGPMSEQHKQHIREATLRRYQNPDERMKTGNSQKGKVISTETRANMSSAKKGKTHPATYGMRGKSHSPETKEKMRLAWLKRKGLAE